jgi:hypothetical protein
LLLDQVELRLLTRLLLSGGDFRQLELQRRYCGRVGLELILGLLRIFCLGYFRDGLGDRSGDRASFIALREPG